MKQEKTKQKSGQKICLIKITASKTIQSNDEIPVIKVTLLPILSPVYYAQSLYSYMPLWREFMDRAIVPESTIWNRLNHRCAVELLPSKDSWIQFTANEILCTLEHYLDEFKMDCLKNHPVGTVKDPSSKQVLTEDEIWDLYRGDYSLCMHVERVYYGQDVSSKQVSSC